MLLLLKLHLVNLLYKVQIRHYLSKTNQKLSQVEYKTLFDSLDNYFIEWFVDLSMLRGVFKLELEIAERKTEA